MTPPGLIEPSCGTSLRRSSSSAASCGSGVPFNSSRSSSFKCRSATDCPTPTKPLRNIKAAAGNWPIIAGDITETYRQLDAVPLLLAFFDTDNYSPTRAALQLCADQLVVGGSIVFDHVATVPDYIDTLGERMAAFEVLGSRTFLHLHNTGVFTKLA